ncbi:hypothetical protein ACWCQL_38250 [Streptomyces sp. NPDC002073]
METTPTPDERAARGADIVREHLAHAEPHDTPTVRAHRGWRLAQMRRAGSVITARFDAFAVNGTGGTFPRIRLADGHVMRVWADPSPALIEEVLLHPGLTAPEEWEHNADGDGYVDGTGTPDGLAYRDVTVKAVRDLIRQHGGEHPEQEPDAAMAEPLIIEAVTDLLHLADGWHSPETVLTRAFGVHWSQTLPAEWSDAANGGQGLIIGTPSTPGPDATPRHRDALAGAVADLYAAAADQYDGTAEEVADQAETAFWEEAQAARLRAVRKARSVR